MRALPSFVKQLNRADLLVAVGLELESAWLPALIDQARNPDVRPGSLGYLDASTAVERLGVPNAQIDRSSGDVHFFGNPHFLVDPVSGARVADAVAGRLSAMRPALRDLFTANAKALKRQLGELLVGAKLTETYDFAKLVKLYRAGRLEEFLRMQDELDALAGALARYEPVRNANVIVDHDAWRYLTATLGLATTGYLESRPRNPTVDLAPAEPGRALPGRETASITARPPYFEQSAIEFVVEATDVTPVKLAHQVGALPETGDYVAMIRENLTRLRRALDGGATGGG